jgi:hypothetical protein
MGIGQEDPRIPTERSEVVNGELSTAPELQEGVWDEERIEKGLKILKEMHIQAIGT